MKFSNFHNLILIQLREPVATSLGCAVLGSPLGNLIGHVVGMSAKKKMMRIDAAGVVAAMQDVQVLGDWSNEDFVCNSVSRSATLTVSDDSVARRILVALPFPALTIGSLVNLGKETFFQRAEPNHVGANAPTGGDCDRLDVVRISLKGGATDRTSKGDTGRLGLHFWSLLNRFRGAMPRVATNNAGAFATLNSTRNGYEMGEFA